MGIFLFVFFFLVGVTGLILGWKKNSQGYLLPESQRGASTELKDWLPVDALEKQAIQTLQDSLGTDYDPTISRMDIRPDKGMVKVTFEHHYWEVQLDGSTGTVLQVAKRRSDFFEQLHDGSIVDRQGNIKWFKLLYTSLLGTSLILFTITGFWLWYGPKVMRRRNRE